MGLRRQTHLGRARKVVRNTRAGRPPASVTNTTPYFSLGNFPVIRKKLLQRVHSCANRKYTGKVTTAACCRAEQGKVFHCTLYGHEPAKLWDCMACQKRIAIEEKAEWITPLVKLSRGSAVPQSLPEVQSALFSENPSHGSSDS